MKTRRHELPISPIRTGSCPRCGMKHLVSSRWVISVTFESIISGLLAAMAVTWIGYYIGVELSVCFAASAVASVPFVCTLIKKSSCRNCDIEFVDANTSAGDEDSFE